VAVAIGKLDALFFILGIFAGIFLFGITSPAFAHFNGSGALGSLTLPVWLNLNTGLIVLAVVLMAIGAFWAGEKCEGKWNVFAKVYGKHAKGDDRP
jgi:uncharacterized protein